MVQNLSAVGSGYAQATGYFSTSSSTATGSNVMSATDKTIQKDPEILVKSSAGNFPGLDEIKSEIANSAKAVREASKALDNAETLLNKMEEQVGLVKNYPPYPAGNEERVEYIKGIEGLRKEIDALVVPRAAEAFPPVFYPRESDFPEIDVKIPSDAAVLAFGQAVQAIKQRVNAGRAELHAQAEILSGQVGSDLPPAEVRNISISVADQLGSTAQSLAGNSGALIQLVG